VGADPAEVSRVPVKPESLTTTVAGGSSSLSPATREQILRVEDLRADVGVLHLLNGLHLSREQMQALLTKCREAKALRDATVAALMRPMRTAETAFAALKQELLKDEVREQTLENAAQANEALKTLKEDFDKKMSELEGRTNQIFNDSQREVLRQFRPCVVPTKEDRDPERVGQAGEPAGFVKVLEHLRSVPAEHLEEAKQRGYEMHVLRWEKHFGKMTDKEKAEVRKQFDTVVAQARAMSNTEFEMSKAELAQNFVMPQSQRTRPRLYEPGKTANLLLDERVLAILEAKLAAQPAK
jgi:hypothetical protein